MGAANTASGGFRLECEMFKPVLAAIPAIFSSGRCTTRVLREPAVGNVVPDLLIGQWEGEASFVIPPLTNVARHILAFLQRHGPRARAQFIEDRLYLTSSALVRALTQLRRAGAVVVVGPQGEVELSPEFDRTTGVKLIAVEMKMTRWREALNQAIRYLDFADEAYVVLDGNQVDVTDEMRRTFELSAPGLYMQRGSELEKVFDPCPVPVTPSADRLFAIHKVLRSAPHCFA